MTTTCDLNVGWNKCPNCARVKERIKDAEEAWRAASANLDRAYAEYREDVAAGRACPATPRQRAWSSYLDDLEMEQSLASSHWREAIDTWAASINEHHRCYEARQQETEEDDVLRDAVRAIEHGGTIQIRCEWDFGYRQGRRAALRELRELRELLDDMIASIDDDTEEGV